MAFVDSDAIFVRNSSALLDLETVPAAFFMRDACKPPNVAWDMWDPGVYVDGERVKKADAYWNTGVVVYEPSAAVAAELWRMYDAGDFASFDPGARRGRAGGVKTGARAGGVKSGNPRDPARSRGTRAGAPRYICEGDLLQTYYWRRFRGAVPAVLDARPSPRRRRRASGWFSLGTDVARPRRRSTLYLIGAAQAGTSGGTSAPTRTSIASPTCTSCTRRRCGSGR